MTTNTYTFPTELWQQILGYATDMDPDLRPEIFADYLIPPMGKDSMRMKLSLQLVSRLFRRISVPFLYEAINSLRARTIVEGAEDTVRALVSHHTVHFQVSNASGMHEPDTWSSLCALVAACTRLQALLFIYSDYNSRVFPLVKPSQMEQFIRVLPQTLQYLYWDMTDNTGKLSDATYTCLAHTRELRALRISAQIAIRGPARIKLQKIAPVNLIMLDHLSIPYPLETLIVGSAWPLRTPTAQRVSIDIFDTTHFQVRGAEIEFPACTTLEIDHYYPPRVRAPGTLARAFPVLRHLEFPENFGGCTENQLRMWDITGPLLSLNTVKIEVVYNAGRPSDEEPSKWLWECLDARLRAIPLHELPSLACVTVRGVSVFGSCDTVEQAVANLPIVGAQLQKRDIELKMELLGDSDEFNFY